MRWNSAYNSKIAKSVALAVIVTGIIVSYGWVADIPALPSPLGKVTMKFSTAISFIFSGIILYFIVKMLTGKVGVAQIALPVSGLVISLFMATVLPSALLGIQIGVENLFVKEAASAIQTTVPGRPSIPTMVNFILIVLAGVLVVSDVAKVTKLLRVIGFTVAVIGSIAVIGYALDSPVLYYNIERVSTAMAVHTASLFVLLGIGLILISMQEPYLKKTESISIRLKVVSLLLLFSIIPIIFIGATSYNATTEAISASDLRNSVSIMGAVTSAITLIFAFLISRSIVKPILKLKSVSVQITNGNFDIRADENPSDEIGELGKSFNSMMGDIKLKDREKEEFAAMISHELKTPLTPIQGYSELLLRGRLGEMNEAQKSSVQVIYDNAKRLSRLIQDILDVRKIELGRLNLEKIDVSTKDVTTQCVNAFEPIIRVKGITLLDGAQDLKLKCDPERIVQVLNNLVNNAVKFVPAENGMIEINTRTDNDSVVFSVKDNGMGIPKEKQQDLFKRFYQADKSLGRQSGGTGLGLAICRGIVEAHGGKIWIESDEGKGTVVYFSIPKEEKA